MDEIRRVDQKEADTIIESRKPIGRFYLSYKEVFVGIDNTTGDAWTEVFDDLQKCKSWLNGDFELGDDGDE